MHAMVLDKIAPIDSSPLILRDVPTPEPAVGEVRVKVRCCAICRTDLHVIEGELPSQKLPLIPGHQVVGVVEALGEGCSRLAVGHRVGIAWLRHTCGRCRYCASGRQNLCDQQRFTGYHTDGGYAQYTLVPEDFAYVLPETFDDTQAAPLLCGGIVGYRALKRSNLPRGGTLAIYGFGSSAHMIAQVALARGCRVLVVTRGEKHQELARQIGAAWAGSSADEMSEAADSAIIFAPVGELVPQALAKLHRGGTLALADIYMTPIPQMDYEKSVFYERDIHAVTANTLDDGCEFLAEAAAIGLRPRTTLYPLRDANRALQDLKGDRISGTGVLVIDG